MKFRLFEDIYEGEKPKFFTNGIKTIKLKPGDEIPLNFYPGRTFNANPYRDNRYPWNCDAYVVPLDLFIEVQGTVEHNGRPYDSSNPDHVKEAEYIKSKAEQLGPKSRYWNIYKWWTEIDPKKLSTLRNNNLNFKLIYPNNLIIDK